MSTTQTTSAENKPVVKQKKPQLMVVGTRSQPVHRPAIMVSPVVGRVVRLSDPEMQPRIAALKAQLADPAKAQKWLEELGYLTPKGNVTKRYR